MKLPESARIVITNTKLEQDSKTRTTCINTEYKVTGTKFDSETNSTKEVVMFWGTFIFPLELEFLINCGVSFLPEEFNKIDNAWDHLFEIKKISEEVIRFVLNIDAKIYSDL